MNTVKAVNRESLSGIEGRNVQQRNFFTANKKQYMVTKQLIKSTFLLYMAVQSQKYPGKQHLANKC